MIIPTLKKKKTTSLKLRVQARHQGNGPTQASDATVSWKLHCSHCTQGLAHAFLSGKVGMGSKDAEEMGKFSLQPNLTTKTKSLAAAAVNKTGLQSPQLQPNVAVLEFHLLPLSSRHGQEPQTRESGLDKTSILDQSCICMKLSHYAAIHAQSLWSCPLF